MLLDQSAKRFIFGCLFALLASAEPSSTVLQYSSEKGGSVSLRCAVDKQDRDVVVYWNRGNACAAPFISIGRKVLIDRFEVVVEESGASLSDYYVMTVSNLTELDEGNYTCAAQSGRTGQMFTQVFNIQLIEAPEVTVETVEENNVLRVRVQTDTEVKCQASGKPIANVRWSRVRGEPERHSDVSEDFNLPISQLLLAQNLSVLHLRRANVSLNGSKFECVASNVAGSRGLRLTTFVEVPPRLRGSTENSVHTAIGNTESLKCIFEANPAPEVQWQYWSDPDKAFVPLPLVERPRKYSSGTKEKAALMHEFSICIFNVQVEDARLYRCLATSELLSETLTKTFNLTFAPSEPVVRVDSAYVFANACNISWYTISTNTTHYNLQIRPVYNDSALSMLWEPIELRHESFRFVHHESDPLKNRPNLSMKSVQRQAHSTVKNACNMQFCSGMSNVVTFLTPDESHIAPSWFLNLKHRAQADVNVQAMTGAASRQWTYELVYFVSLCIVAAHGFTNCRDLV